MWYNIDTEEGNLKNQKGYLMKIFALLALFTMLPNPSALYYSWFSPEIADIILQYAADGEYHPHLDYDGDGKLSAKDAVFVKRRYMKNIICGNEMTIDETEVNEIIAENYTKNVLYWEFDYIDNVPCRGYAITTNKITYVNLYIEFEDFSFDNVEIKINPFEERIQVIS